MRPFQIILLAGFGGLAILGLVVFSMYSNSNSGPQVGTVAIWGTLPQKAMDDAINTLKTGSKQFAGVSYKQIDPSTFDNDLANALSSGSGPDLIIIDQEQLYEDAPKVTIIPSGTISARTFTDSYVDIDDAYLNSTGTYAIPLVVDPLVLYYNKTLLNNADITTPPTSWQAVPGMALAITKTDSNQHITTSTVPFGEYNNVSNARAILSLLFLQAGSHIVETSGTILRSDLGDTSVTTSDGTSPGQSALNFYTQFADPGRTVYTWNASLPNSKQAFISGDLAFYPGFASEEPYLKAANPNLSFDMAPIPQASAGSSGRLTYGLAYALAIPKVSMNKSGAYTVAVALTGAAVESALAQELSMAPATRTLLSNTGTDPFAAVYYPEALNAKGWISPPPQTVDQVFSAMISNVTSNSTNVQGALAAADQAIDAAFH